MVDTVDTDEKFKIGMTEKPTTVIFLGQAGSGRSNVLASLAEHLNEKKTNVFSINLDPLMESESLYNINIRDSIPYDSIKCFYNFTHNKTLTTSLNIFGIKFNQVMQILSSKASSLQYILVDIPNPEIFLWSSSGNVILQTLSSIYPTVILYVIDSQICQEPLSFLNVIIDACSLKMRYGLPLITVFNKNDLIDWSIIEAWMSDSSALMQAIISQEGTISNTIAANVYNLQNICEEIQVVVMSALRNEGLNELIERIDQSRVHFEESYKPINKGHDLRIISSVKKQINNLKSCHLLKESLGAPIKEKHHYVKQSNYDSLQEKDDNFNEELIGRFMENNFFSIGPSKILNYASESDDDK